MSYSLVFDDQFQRANTTPGSGANSTTGAGNGWIDFVGTVYNISSDLLYDGISSLNPTSPVAQPLYRPSGEHDAVNGKVRIFTRGGAGGAVARWNPANGGTGYGVFVYPNDIFLDTVVNGVSSRLQVPFADPMGNPVTGYPSMFVMDMIFQQTGAGTTQITVNVYSPSDLNTILITHTFSDTTAALQNLSGAMGVGSYSSAYWSEVQLYTASSALTAGAASVVSVYKTVANLSASAATGGTGSITYQWYQSTASGVQGTAIAGAASFTPQITGLTPSTSYWYTLVATDSATPTPSTVTYPQINVATLAANTKIIAFIGDSISADIGASSSATGLMAEFLIAANGAGIPCVGIGLGHSGATLAGYDLSATFAASLACGGLDAATIMLGTNDAKVGIETTAVNYRADYITLLDSLSTNIPSMKSAQINYSPAFTPGAGGVFDATSIPVLQSYQPEIDSLNGLVIGNLHVYEGDTTAYAFFAANPEDLADGIHPNDTGYAYLGPRQAAKFVAYYAPTVTTQPTLQNLTVGGGLTLTCAFAGIGLTYQWNKGGTPISGATSIPYVETSAQTTDAGSYTCTATNGAGSVTTAAAVVTVAAASGGPVTLSEASLAAIAVIVAAAPMGSIWVRGPIAANVSGSVSAFQPIEQAVGNTGGYADLIISDQNGILSLSGWAATGSTVSNTTGSAVSSNVACTIESANGGIVRYPLQNADTANADRISLRLKLTGPTGQIEYVGPITISVQ